MPRVVYHPITDSYPNSILSQITGAETYPGRVLASTNPGDVVILPPALHHEYLWAKDHYTTIGLDCAKEVLFGGFEHLKNFPQHELCTFYFGASAHRARPDQRWFETTRRFNNKNYFIKTARELDVKTPRTTCYRCKEDVSMPKQFPVYVKLAVGASGNGVWRCEDIETFNSAVDECVQLGGDFQVQEALPAGTVFCNSQWEVNKEGELLPGPVTEQILDGNSHNGNISPTFHAKVVQHAVLTLAQAVHHDGMKGVFAFDVAVTPKGEVLPIECNPRWNGASYNSKVAEKLGLNEWQSINVTFRASTLHGTSLTLANLAFEQKTKEGIIVINWGCVGGNKLGLLVAGNQKTRKDYLDEFRCRFG